MNNKLNIKFPKKTIPLNLSLEEFEKVEKLSEEKGVSKPGMIRSALRFYLSLQAEVNKGDGWRLETRIVDKDGNEVRKLKYIE